MFSRHKKESGIDLEQHEQIEYAQMRINQKKNLYRHFVWFLIGGTGLVIINKVFKYGESYDWAYWAIGVWSMLFLVHLVNVFILNPFMGRDWERKQRERLVLRQKEKIANLRKQVEKEFPLPPAPKKKVD
ncbi:2TM domain-containing protein [Muriicola soli]|uniref:2TM domain-containing protein n=1 Tax=Muriicola soli TaxID=2507538 RepID=A0A411E6V4_9FLAO|nr:2TM domain-containing protein [Muriicola soli]QBA63367.1 2TM domain-containing protein [Muriicola soli]